MLVRDAMLPTPLLVAPETSVLELCTMVLDCNQTTATVVDSTSHLCGIVSVQDVFHRILPHYVDMDSRLAGLMHEGYFEEKFAAFKHLTVGEIMTKEVDTLRPGDAVIEAVGMFYRKGHKTIPVIEDGLYIGSITRRSVLRRVTTESC